LVGAGEQRGWHAEVDCLSGLEIDHKFKFSRRLHGAGLRASRLSIFGLRSLPRGDLRDHKGNEAHTKGLRDPVDEDAELALHAVGFVLRDIGWAA
jgi:hypothetical protein